MNRGKWRGLVAMVLLAVAANHDFLSPARGASLPGAPSPYDFAGFYNQLEPYLLRYHDPAFPDRPTDLRGRFSYQPGGAYDLYGSCDVVYLLWTIGELEPRTTAAGRAEWAGLIQSFQDPSTGWFDRGNETPHFKEHATAYATGALALLGARPRYPFRWAEKITASRKSTERWLGGIWWDVVWVGSHQGGGVAAALAMSDSAPEEWFDWYFDWLDHEVNPVTGLWQRAFYNRVITRPNKNDLGGAAHFWWIYEYRHRPLPFPERVIDTCLKLQLESGLWDRKPRKGDFPYCINLDAINGLAASSRQLRSAGQGYRTPDILAALEKYLRRTNQVLTSPGALARLYTNSHDLPGALIGVAEADQFMKAVAGQGRIQTRAEWRSVLGTICWL